MQGKKTQLNLVMVGHVDHGKSAVVGRLLHDAGALPEGKLETVQAASARRGVAFEWAFVMDALQTERDQGITIEASTVWFSTPSRRVAIIDAPGHREFLKNMITGAAHADAALLVVDATQGVSEQTRRHAYLLHLLGIGQVAVLVNKMDAVKYAAPAFNNAAKDITEYLGKLGIVPMHIIPVSAREGDNIVQASAHMAFYKGPGVLQALDAFQPLPADAQKPLRFPVQDVYKFDERRIIAGRVESGHLKLGDELLFSPSGARARVTSFEAWPEGSAPREASAGQSIGITLDKPIFVERGQVASHTAKLPMLTSAFRSRVFWLGQKPLAQGQRVRIRIGTAEAPAEVREIESIMEVESLEKKSGTSIPPGGAAEVIFRARTLMAMDAASRMVIMEGHHIAGGGTIDLTGFSDQRVEIAGVKSQNLFTVTQGITPAERIRANGHAGGILWFTGLSGAGKTTLAQALQKALFAKGQQVFVLDGDTVRKGLSRDLGFSAKDRHENLRRAGEVAALFAEAGFIVITAFISPTHADRALARACAPDLFHTVYVKADLATCEGRDVKGLYRKARAGEIAEFTGISAPYEAPSHADVVLDTAAHDVKSCLRQLLDYVERQFVEPVRGL